MKLSKVDLRTALAVFAIALILLAFGNGLSFLWAALALLFLGLALFRPSREQMDPHPGATIRRRLSRLLTWLS